MNSLAINTNCIDRAYFQPEVSLRNLEACLRYCDASTLRVITLKAADSRGLEDLQHSVENLSWKRVGYTKDIRIKYPFRTNLRRRCLHHRSQVAGAEAEGGDDSDDVGVHLTGICQDRRLTSGDIQPRSWISYLSRPNADTNYHTNTGP